MFLSKTSQVIEAAISTLTTCELIYNECSHGSKVPVALLQVQPSLVVQLMLLLEQMEADWH